MTLMRRKKTAPKPEPTKTAADRAAEAFAFSYVAGDGNLKQAAERLREMSSNERRELRRSLQRLDYLMDDVSLELMSRRSRTDE